MNQQSSRTIVHVVQHLAPGGIETLALDFLNFAQPADDVYIISLEGCKEEAIQAWPKLKPYSQQLIFLNKKPGVQWHLVRDIRAIFCCLHVDVVHTHHIGPLFYAGLAAKLSRIPARLHTEHDVWHLADRKQRWLQQSLIKLTRPRLIADARMVKQRLHQLIHYPDITAIYNGIDTQRFVPGSQYAARRLLGLPETATLIGSAGRLETVKGHDLLILTLPQLPEHIHLALAGTGSQMIRLRQLTELLGVQSRVHFLGRVDDMPLFYQSLDLFCLPSRNEGFPLTAIEAQSCGIPALLTRVGACNEAICPLTGSLAEPGQPRFLQQGIVTAITNGRPTPSPRQFVVSRFDIRTIMSQYQQLIAAEA